MLPPGFMIMTSGQIMGPSGRWLKDRFDRHGYKMIKVAGKNRYVHHLVCEAFNGQRPSQEHQVRHLDGNKLNNRAGNLAWGTAQDNSDDMLVHGTRSQAEAHHNVKLTDDQVSEIRMRFSAGESQTRLASEFGVTQPQVSKIVNMKQRRASAIRTRPAWRKDQSPSVVQEGRDDHSHC